MRGEKRMTNAMVLNRMDFMELTHDEMMCVDGGYQDDKDLGDILGDVAAIGVSVMICQLPGIGTIASGYLSIKHFWSKIF
jgi:hypothetical protein